MSDSGRMIRVFAGVAASEGARRRLEALSGRLGGALPGVRWVPPENYHLTLAFLGDVAETDLHEVCRAVGEAAGGHGRIGLRLRGAGAFPGPRQPRVIWAGVTGGEEELCRLSALASDVRRAASDAGYPTGDDRFAPHVTLGRFKPGRSSVLDATEALGRAARWDGGAFPVEEVLVYGSTLKAEGVAYAVLSRRRLKGD